MFESHTIYANVFTSSPFRDYPPQKPRGIRTISASPSPIRTLLFRLVIRKYRIKKQ
jgi:hypothetical protein